MLAIQKQILKVEEQITDNTEDQNKNRKAHSGKKVSKVGSLLGGHADDLKANLTSKIEGIPGGKMLSGLAAMTGPVGIGIAALSAAVVGLGVNLYHLDKEFAELRKQTDMLGISLNDADQVISKTAALSKHFGKDSKEILSAAKVMSDELGVSVSESLKVIQDSLVKTNGELDLNNIKEYISQAEKGSEGAKKFGDLISNIGAKGYDTGKLLDASKDFGLAIDKAEDSTKQVFAKIGKSKLLVDYQKGLVPKDKVFAEVFGSISKYSKQTAGELKSLAGGAGEDVGNKALETLAKIKAGTMEMTKEQKKREEQTQYTLELESNLEAEKLRASKGIADVGRIFNNIWIGIQTEFYKTIADWREIFTLEALGGWSQAIDITLLNMQAAFQTIYELAKATGNVMSGNLYGAGQNIAEIVDIKKKLKNDITFLKLVNRLDKEKDAKNEAEKQKIIDQKNNIDNKLNMTTTNAVQGATSEVKNIVLNLGSLQRIDKQIIGNSVDVKNLQNDLLQSLLQVANDINQVGQN